jgi:hypothetical protein
MGQHTPKNEAKNYHGVSTNLNPDVRVDKAPPHVGHIARVGAWRPDEIGVLAGAVRVPGAEHRGAQAVSVRQWVEFLADRVMGAVVGIAESRLVGIGRLQVLPELVRQSLAVEQTLAGAVLNGHRARELTCSGHEEESTTSDVHLGLFFLFCSAPNRMVNAEGRVREKQSQPLAFGLPRCIYTHLTHHVSA